LRPVNQRCLLNDISDVGEGGHRDMLDGLGHPGDDLEITLDQSSFLLLFRQRVKSVGELFEVSKGKNSGCGIRVEVANKSSEVVPVGRTTKTLTSGSVVWTSP
jgi:hypothetical protein